MPLIDMANHTTDNTTAFRVVPTSKGGLELRAPPLAEAQTEQKGQETHWRGLHAGDEVCLQYGPHSNWVRLFLLVVTPATRQFLPSGKGDKIVRRL